MPVKLPHSCYYIFGYNDAHQNNECVHTGYLVSEIQTSYGILFCNFNDKNSTLRYCGISSFANFTTKYGCWVWYVWTFQVFDECINLYTEGICNQHVRYFAYLPLFSYFLHSLVNLYYWFTTICHWKKNNSKKRKRWKWRTTKLLIVSYPHSKNNITFIIWFEIATMKQTFKQ